MGKFKYNTKADHNSFFDATLIWAQKYTWDSINMEVPFINEIFEINDFNSGLGREKYIPITIDNQFVLPEWDPEERTVYTHIDTTFSLGESELKLNFCKFFSTELVY